MLEISLSRRQKSKKTALSVSHSRVEEKRQRARNACAQIKQNGQAQSRLGKAESSLKPVSYTHLTLPTIYSV